MSSKIVSRIKEHLRADPTRPVLFAGHAVLSASDVLTRIEAAEAALLNHGNPRKIALALPTSLEALILFIAALNVAENTIYFDPGWPAETRTQIMGFVQPDLLIDEAAWTQMEGNENAEDATHYTCFTSGSTGLPKGCMRDEQSWVESFAADQPFSEITPRATIIVAGSFAHSLFTYAAIRGLVAGAKILLLPHFHPGELLRQMRGHDEIVLFAVPTQLDALVNAANKPDLHMRKILTTGSKLAPELARRVKARFPRADLIEFYGTSELSYVAARHVQPDDAPTLVGKPLAPVQVAIEDAAGKPSAAGEMGRVFVRSPLAFTGYVTPKGFMPAPDKISVGDTGFLDAEGALHLVGRADRMLQVSGRNVAPEEIEAALQKLAYVQCAAVFGATDPRRGHRLVAVVQLASPTGRAQLLADLRPHLTAYLMPQSLYHCDDWPHTSSGKTDLQTLEAALVAGKFEVMA